MTTPQDLLPIAQWAQRHRNPDTGRPFSDRQVKRWLADDELPGAVKDESGRWLIPADATRRPQLRPLPTSSTPSTLARVDARPVPLDALPSFLTVEQASLVLGISRYAIESHRDYFDVVPFGAHGSHVVPLATIKRIRG
jgi:hypothetical protein